MKKFKWLEIDEAYNYSLAGGQALHLHRIIVNYDTAPRCFITAVERGQDIAHLFDQDLTRLKQTAVQLGVRIVVVENLGKRNQHIDLCGRPLRLAKRLCVD